VAGKVLLKGGCVLTLGSKIPNFAQADVLIADGRVAEVGPGLRARDAETIDTSDTVVMPGFVDCHRHVWKSLFRRTEDSAGQADAYGQYYQPDDVYAATLIGLLGAVEAGVTTVVDWSDIRCDDQFTDAALQAHADAGLRSVFVHAAPNWEERDPHPGLARLVGDTSPVPPMTSLASGHGDPDRNQPDVVAAEWNRARQLGVRIHAHAGRKTPDRGTISPLAESNLLGEDVTLAHCSHLDDADLDAIAWKGTAVALTPVADMAGGRGAPPIQKLLDRNIRPGLGVDDEGIAPGDMFAQMRAVISLQHATLFDIKLAGKAGVPKLLSTRDVIRYATVDAARVAGLNGVTGSIEPGRQADLIVLRTDRPNISPINDPIGAVVWGMDTSNLDWVFAGGRTLMRNGVLEADVERARDLAVTAQRRVVAAAGFMVESGHGGTP
jgi:5-methylthioadenosine/S-adenosylhomocysteine deaminase